MGKFYQHVKSQFFYFQISNTVSELTSFEFDLELEPVLSNITWFRTLLRNYSRFETTKLELAENVSATTTTAVAEMLTTMTTRMELLAFEPMRNRIRNAKSHLRDWYEGVASVVVFGPVIHNSRVSSRNLVHLHFASTKCMKL